MLSGHGVDVALAEDGVLLAAVRALEVAVVLHQAQHGNVHHLGHLDGLGDDHAHQILGRGDHDDPVHREGLEHSQGHVTGSGRHIHEEIVQLAPDDIGPELLDSAGNDRAAPDDGVGLILGEEVEAHHLHPALGGLGVDAQLAARGPGVDAESLGDGGAGDVGVQDADLLAQAGHGAGQRGGHQALADAALSADHGDDLLDVGELMGRDLEALGAGALRAALAAGGAVVGAFRHGSCSFFLVFLQVNGDHLYR